MLIQWNNCTASQLSKLIKESIVVFAIGSCEQHSHYLPVGTDTLIGERLLLEAASKAKEKILILPTITFGYSMHHTNFSGYITLKQDTIKKIIIDVCDSLYAQSVKEIIILNSHGGNQSVLQVAINEIWEKNKKSPVLVTYWSLIADEINAFRESSLGGIGHAGEFEVSLMKEFYPELVHDEEISEMEEAKGDKWFNPDMFARNKVYFIRAFDFYSKDGNIGQPQLATEKKGEIFANIIINKLAELLNYYS